MGKSTSTGKVHGVPQCDVCYGEQKTMITQWVELAGKHDEQEKQRMMRRWEKGEWEAKIIEAWVDECQMYVKFEDWMYPDAHFLLKLEASHIEKILSGHHVFDTYPVEGRMPTYYDHTSCPHRTFQLLTGGASNSKPKLCSCWGKPTRFYATCHPTDTNVRFTISSRACSTTHITQYVDREWLERAHAHLQTNDEEREPLVLTSPTIDFVVEDVVMT